MSIDKATANRVLTNLDSAAERIEGLVKAKKLDPRLASSLLRDIDTFADRFEVVAFGKNNLQRRMAKVLQCDSDEKHYMNTYDNPIKVISGDSDEPYMHASGASFNSKSVDTYDQDPTSAVSERNEYTVRDMNEHGSTQKQPSWARGPAGKSTHQGAVKPSVKGPKTWAP